MAEPDIQAALQNVKVFEGVAPQGLALIASVATAHEYGAGESLFQEGSTGDALYLILKGKVRISRQISGMGEEALAILESGDAFGEMSLIDEVPRSADATAHSPCKVLAISKEAMEDLLFLHKDLAYEILWNFVKVLARRLRETNDKMTFLSVSSKF